LANLTPSTLQTLCFRIIFAFQEYAREGDLDVARWEHNYRQLGDRHRALLHKQPLKIAAARRCIHQNSLFIKALLSAFDADNSEDGTPQRYLGANAAAEDIRRKQGRCSVVDVDKVRTVCLKYTNPVASIHNATMYDVML
jgi:hypothetical protein